MTEAEWLACPEPTPMLSFLRGKASDRKLRLFAAACCRHVWQLLANQQCRKAVEISERYADGNASATELQEANEAVSRSIPNAPGQPRSESTP